MISIHQMFEGKRIDDAKRHLKKHWRKYALGAGGIAAYLGGAKYAKANYLDKTTASNQADAEGITDPKAKLARIRHLKSKAYDKEFAGKTASALGAGALLAAGAGGVRDEVLEKLGVKKDKDKK